MNKEIFLIGELVKNIIVVVGKNNSKSAVGFFFQQISDQGMRSIYGENKMQTHLYKDETPNKF